MHRTSDAKFKNKENNERSSYITWIIYLKHFLLWGISENLIFYCALWMFRLLYLGFLQLILTLSLYSCLQLVLAYLETGFVEKLMIMCICIVRYDCFDRWLLFCSWGDQHIWLCFWTKYLIIMINNGMFKQNDQSGCVCVPELIVDIIFSYIPYRFI